MELDLILTELGQCGRYQVTNYVLISLPLLFSSMFALVYVFTAGTVSYRCRIPECESIDGTFRPAWLRDAVPVDSIGVPSTCERYSSYNSSDGVCGGVLFFADQPQRCDSWVFETDEQTIATEFDLLCENNDWKLALVGSVNNLGQFIGMLLAGLVSDRIGRRSALVAGSTLGGALGVLRSFAWNYESFISLEFLEPVFSAGIYPAGFVLALELVGADRREFVGAILSVGYALGEVLLGVLAWALGDWRWLLRAVYMPALFFVSYHWLVPESIRWLVTQERPREASLIVQKAAKVNQVKLSEEALGALELGALTGTQESGAKTTTRRGSLRQVLRSRLLLLRLANCCFCWLTNTLVYYGLSLCSVALSGDKYSNFVLTALVEIPAYVCSIWALRRGRKPSLCLSLLLSGACCITSAVVPADLDWTRLTLFLVGKFAITLSFTVIYVFTAELFPTPTRHSLIGACAMVGRVGSMIAPQTPLLARIMKPLPLLLFGTMGITSGLLGLLLPETVHRPLPDTMDEAERL